MGKGAVAGGSGLYMGTAALSERDYVERPDWSSTRSAPLVMLGAAASRPRLADTLSDFVKRRCCSGMAAVISRMRF